MRTKWTVVVRAAKGGFKATSIEPIRQSNGSYKARLVAEWRSFWF